MLKIPSTPGSYHKFASLQIYLNIIIDNSLITVVLRETFNDRLSTFIKGIINLKPKIKIDFFTQSTHCFTVA